MKRMVLILLMALSLGAADKQDLTFVYQLPSIKYQRCDSCGRDVPEGMGMLVRISLEQENGSFYSITSGVGLSAKANRKAMFPYGRSKYFVCMRCILETLGVKPEWQLPATSPEE
jgi:hypothetical protein